jgi:hypothetical protein
LSLCFHSRDFLVQKFIRGSIFNCPWNVGSSRVPLPAIAGIVFLALCAVPEAGAQTSEQGLRIVGVSLSETYFAQAVPDGIVAYGDVFLGSAASVTGAASIQWTRVRAKSYWNIRLTPVFESRFGANGSKSWNQSVTLSYNKRVANKWTVALSGAGQVMNFDESLFSPPTVSQVASSGASFDNLSGAVLQGQSPDPQLNSIAYGSLQPSQSIQTFLYGQRTANAAAQASLTYARSARLSISFVAGGVITRHLNSQSDPAGLTYPQVTSDSTGVNLNYALSPRTQIGASVSVSQSQSLNLKANVRTFSGSISRTMSRRWFVQASLGAGSATTGDSHHSDGLYSAGLGFKTYSNTALVAYNRTLDDPYALALGALQHSEGITATWHYGHLGSSWWLDSSYTQLIAVYKGVPGTNTWSIMETAGRRLGRNYAVTLEYTMGRVGAKRYIQDGRQYQLEQTGIRTTFSWSPQTPHP